MSKATKKGSASRAPQITYQYVGPECNGIVLPDNSVVVPGNLSSEEITALLAKWTCLQEYWILAEEPIQD